MASTETGMFDLLKNEIAAYWAKRADSLAQVALGIAPPFHSDAVSDPQAVNKEAASIVQKEASTKGVAPVRLIPPQNMAYALLISCRSERCAEMSRVACMSALANEANLMKTMAPAKMDGLKT